MKNHLTSNYCPSLISRGIIDDCERAKSLTRIPVRVIKEAGYPIDSGSGWGNAVQCHTNDGIVTEECGGGRNFGDCNGHQTYGRCERYDFGEQFKRVGYW